MIRKVLAALLVPLDRLIYWVTAGNFALKDVFTTFNLICGVASIVYAIEGNQLAASFAIMIGYLGGDVLDGPVARITGRLNKFGGKLDTIADHTAQCIAPACVVYIAYRDMSPYLGFGLAALLIAAATIRHARSELLPFEFDLCWKGLPRPAGSFIILGYLNSALYMAALGPWGGVAIVTLVSVFYLVPVPFVAHHGRRLQLHVLLVIFSCFASSIVFALVFPVFFWDVIFFWMFGYAWTSWIALLPEERRAYFAAVREWRAEMRRRMAGETGDQ